MEPVTQTQAEAMHAQLLADLDRLAARLDDAATQVKRLRDERDQLAAAWQRLCGEAGVRDADGLSGVVARWKSLEQENRQLQRERESIAKRLATLLEKVDLLQRDS
jgi:chromosome segregation ATPase